jgi:hypothetical protein
MGTTSRKKFRKLAPLQMESRVVLSPTGLQDVNYRTVWKADAQPKLKKELRTK